MPMQDEVVAARDAVRSLKQAVDVLARRYPDTVDLRRLRSDVARLDEDLDLLCGRAVQEPASRPPLEVIPDKEYAQDFWMDAEDEGLGRSG
jgi:hypothetical protein